MGTVFNKLTIAGAILVVLGGAGLAVPVFSTQGMEDVVKIGDLKVQVAEKTAHTIPPLASGGALILGIVLLGGGAFRSGRV